MASDFFLDGKTSGSGGVASPLSATSPSQAQRSNPLSSKITSILSTNYTDSDIRDALALLDRQQLENSPETRRLLRLNVQRDVIQSNAEIIREFAHVAEVCFTIKLGKEPELIRCSNSIGLVIQSPVSHNAAKI